MKVLNGPTEIRIYSASDVPFVIFCMTVGEFTANMVLN